MTPVAIAAGLETVLDSVLRLDPDTQVRLAGLDGKVIAIEPAPENIESSSGAFAR